MPLVLYSWRRKDPRTGRWRALRWKMTDADAAAWAKREGVEIEQIPGSREERTASGQFTPPVPGCSTGAMFITAQSVGAIEAYFDEIEKGILNAPDPGKAGSDTR